MIALAGGLLAASCSSGLTSSGSGEPGEEPPAAATSDPSGESGETSFDPQDVESEVRAVAQSYADAVNADDEEAAIDLMCSGDGAGSLFEVAGGENAEVSIGEVTVYAADDATAEILMGDSSTMEGTPLPLEYHDKWCVAV